MKKYRFFPVILLFLFLAISRATASAAPQTKHGITLDPFIKQLTLLPGVDQQDFDVRITNNTGSDNNFGLTAIDFGSLNDTGGLVFAGANESDLLKKYGLAQWLALPNDNIFVKQGESVVLRTSVRNDNRLSPGGHYGAILITPDPKSKTSKVNVSQTISVLVLAIKKGGDVYDLRLEKLKDNHTLFRDPSTATITFHNPGNVHVVPRGSITMHEGKRLVSKGIINEESGFVLPETNRTFTTTLRPIARPDGLFVKTYMITADYRYDGLNTFATKTYKIRVLNVRNILLGLALIILLVLCVKHRKYIVHRLSTINGPNK